MEARSSDLELYERLKSSKDYAEGGPLKKWASTSAHMFTQKPTTTPVFIPPTIGMDPDLPLQEGEKTRLFVTRICLVSDAGRWTYWTVYFGSTERMGSPFLSTEAKMQL